MANGYDDGKIIAHLRAEVERLTADRTALIHRLEALMDRWGSGRNALIRAVVAGDGDWVRSYVNEARAEMLLRCIKELNGAIPGE